MNFDSDWTLFDVKAEIELHGATRLCAEHNKLRARVAALEKLEQRVAENEELDRYSGKDGCRAWSTTGAWLYPGDRVIVLRG